MKNIKHTIAYADLNSKVVQEITVPYIYSGTTVLGETYSGTWYPNEIQVINNTNANLEWTTVKDDIEYADYLINSGTLYHFIPFPKDSVLEDTRRFYRCEKLLIRGVDTSADTDLDVVFINYVPLV